MREILAAGIQVEFTIAEYVQNSRVDGTEGRRYSCFVELEEELKPIGMKCGLLRGRIVVIVLQ